jgi:hypothetical protein
MRAGSGPALICTTRLGVVNRMPHYLGQIGCGRVSSCVGQGHDEVEPAIATEALVYQKHAAEDKLREIF